MNERDLAGAGDPFPRARLYGVYPAVVVDVNDPDGQGRVRIELPFVDGFDAGKNHAWARLATFMAGASRGAWFVPEPTDEVLVAFYAGDPRRPVVIGALWNGADAPPETMHAGNNLRSITSRGGHTLRFDDTAGTGNVVLRTAGGQQLELSDASNGVVTLKHSSGASIEIHTDGSVSIRASSNVRIEAANLTVSAGMVTVDAGMAKFSGVVKTDTLIANSVVASSYTPGAGNVW